MNYSRISGTCKDSSLTLYVSGTKVLLLSFVCSVIYLWITILFITFYETLYDFIYTYEVIRDNIIKGYLNL